MADGFTKEQVAQIVENQREFFRSGRTLDVDWRILQLKRLKGALIAHTEQLQSALYEDLKKSPTEAYLCDIGSAVMEINEIIRSLRRWARPELHPSGLLCFPSLLTKVNKLPYGVCLIMSPYNFPVLLTVGVLAACICGGNTAVVKPSSKSSATTRVLRSMLEKAFPPEYIAVVDGGHDVSDLCLDERFDKIFYTGSPAVAKHVLAKAAENLTPAALELGGETGNWCLIRKDAALADAARKIAFFKACNSGQICININQIAVAQEVAEEFIGELKKAFRAQLGEHACENPEYPCLITDAAYRKCADAAESCRERIVFGGRGDDETRRFDPTVIYPVSIDEPLVQRELFSPLLPIVPFADSEADEVLKTIARREHGLALYLFTSDLRWADRVMATQQYGGGCVNEVCVHMMVPGVPFNGTGHSGMGAYHGKWGFREFTHPATVLYGSSRLNLPLREHPYGGKSRWKEKIVRLMER